MKTSGKTKNNFLDSRELKKVERDIKMTTDTIPPSPPKNNLRITSALHESGGSEEQRMLTPLKSYF